MNRLGSGRAVVSLAARTLICLLLIALAPVLVFWPFGRSHAPMVEVHDEEGILQSQAVVANLSDLRFREDVRLEVLTLDADYDAAFNSLVLDYARSEEPSWISADNPNYWADGVVIVAVSAEGRWVGTYFGEDVKVPLSVQSTIQDAGKGALRRSDWAGGIQDVAAEAATRIGKPVDVTGTLAVILWVVSAVGLIALVVIWWLGFAALARHRRAVRHYSHVTRDWDTTELLAGTIPQDEPHGAQVLERFHWFQGEYHELTRSMNAASGWRGADWFSRPARRDSRALLKRARSLDSLDDAIANASALLTMSSTWRAAWDNEVGPVYEDLAAFEELCTKVDKSSVDVSTHAQRTWIGEARARLATLTVDLDQRRVSPSQALDALDDLSNQTREQAEELAGRAIEMDTSTNGDERRRQYGAKHADWIRSQAAYSGTWAAGDSFGRYSPDSTIRLSSGSVGLPAAGSSSYVGVAPLAGLVTGYSSASTWTPPSSGGSSHGGIGGGGGGGGFSGAGSSSHF